MPARSRRCTRCPGDDGFTLVEMIIAVSLGAIVFTALAAYLGGGLKLLAIQKSRTQANEIATEAIEDLQRLDDEYLGVCAAVSPPPDFSNTVMLPNCPSSLPATLQEPCTPTAGDIPDHEYQCRRFADARVYNVRRYVSWLDPVAKTEKRLGVFVSWTDSAGSHEVSQQSARTRRPAPAVTSAMVTPTTSFNVDIAGTVTTGTPLGLSAHTTGISATDNVRAIFKIRDGDGSTKSGAVPLTTNGVLTADGGLDWTGSISPSAFKFPHGSQVFTITAARADDRVQGSALATPAVTFNCATCSTPPTISVAVNPTTVDIDAAGALVAPFTVTATTTGAASGDVVTLFLPTQPAVRGMTMTCSFPTCTTTITLATAQARSFRLPGGGSSLVAQIVKAGATQPTAVSAPTAVTFQ